MSKAFTREENAPEDVLPSLPRPARGEVRCVTAEGFKALQAELASLDPSSRRAQMLAATLPLLTVHAPPCEGRVVFGCWVKLRDGDGHEGIWRIVGPDEADVRGRRLSASSPLARALFGRAPGDVVALELPRGPAEYEILAVASEDPGEKR